VSRFILDVETVLHKIARVSNSFNICMGSLLYSKLLVEKSTQNGIKEANKFISS